MVQTVKNSTKGHLLTVSAPSGAGKTSLVRAVVELDDNLQVSVSHTTRPMRPGEIDGKNYHFTNRAAFEKARDEGAFFEWAEVFGNLYGTAKSQVERTLAEGIDVILEIDWQGAQQVKRVMPGCCTIFIVPPSVATLEARLRSRGQDDDATIARRMADAKRELGHCIDGDYLVLNDDFETAQQDLQAIIRSERLRTMRQRQSLHPVLDDLLGQ